MELRHLRYFVSVAEELHFGRAAAKLNISQPPLSKQIRELEDELGVRLFRRTSRRVELTPAGRTFLEGARRALVASEEAVLHTLRTSQGEEGRLALGFVGSAIFSVLPGLLDAFHRAHPAIELAAREMPTLSQVKSLLESDLDAGVLRPPIGTSDLVTRTLSSEPLIAVLPARHRLASRDEISVEILAGEPLILPPSQYGGLRDIVLCYCRRAGFEPVLVHEAVAMETVVGLVSAGLGISLVPKEVSLLCLPGAVYRPLQHPPVIEMALAWRANNPNPVLAKFLATVFA